MEKQKLECSYTVSNWMVKANVYTLKIRNKIISEDAELEFLADHINGKNDQDVEAVSFEYCTISKVPQGLTQIFPNLNILQIFKSKLKLIEQKDLNEYKHLIIISLPCNEISFISGDLFAGMKSLERIWLNSNKIEVIEPNLLDDLDNLKTIDFSQNLCIDKRFDSIGCDGKASLEEIKSELREIYSLGQ